MEHKRKRGRPRKNPVPSNTEQPKSKIGISKEQQQLNAINALFRKIQQAQPVIEYRIRNYTEEDLERYTSDIVRYQSQLIDLNNYAYMVLGLFCDLIDFYIKPIMYRWTLNTRVKHYNFNQQDQDQLLFQQDYISYAAKINKLNLGREFHRILLTMFLEDAVFGYWVEDEQSSTIFYLPSSWCVLRNTVNGNWTYLLNTPRISERDIENLPSELSALVRRYKPLGGDDALAPVDYEKVVCFKYNDHTNVIFPPFTHVLLLIIDLMKAKKLALTQSEQDVINLIQMLIPIDEKNDDHLRFTDPVIERFSIGLQELMPENNAILPTPMELSVLDSNKKRNVDVNIVTNAMEAYHNETGLPRFGGSNTAAEMKRALEFAASKVFVLLDQISNSINLKMKFDGFFYDNYEFVYEILHMTQFNKSEFVDDLLKQSQAGGLVKLKIEAARGNDPCMFIGQHYTENVVFRNILDNLVVPPSSHTQTSSGRPPGDDGNLSEAGEQAREDNTNDPENRAYRKQGDSLKKIVLVSSTAKVKLLVDAGFSPLGTRVIDGNTLYQFIVTDELFSVLSDKSKFCENDYVFDSKMTF